MIASECTYQLNTVLTGKEKLPACQENTGQNRPNPQKMTKKLPTLYQNRGKTKIGWATHSTWRSASARHRFRPQVLEALWPKRKTICQSNVEILNHLFNRTIIDMSKWFCNVWLPHGTSTSKKKQQTNVCINSKMKMKERHVKKITGPDNPTW